MKIDLPFVYVVWEDSNREGREWTAIHGHKPRTVTCVSAGWLISETEEAVTLSGNLGMMSLDREGEEGLIPGSFVHAMSIPRIAIREWWEVPL